MSAELHRDSWDEKRLVSGLKEGQEEAFRVLVHMYRSRVFGIAYGITLDREESLDIVQEVFLKVFEKIGGFREASKLSTWLHRITVNQCLNWRRRWRRRFRWHHESMDSMEDHGSAMPGTGEYDPAGLYQQRELERAFWRSLKALPPETRAVLVLKELEGLSYEEIAETLGIKAGTVSSRLFYGRKRLKEKLAPYTGEGETPAE